MTGQMKKYRDSLEKTPEPVLLSQIQTKMDLRGLMYYAKEKGKKVMERIKVTRKTTESEMNVVLDFAPLKKDYRKYIKTPIPFLNHMIEHIAWRGEVNIDVDLKLDEFVLTHVICEDLDRKSVV